ncbi:hypothetical protein HYQ46_004220 [Verticillium longisporum]|nr:hypothetical protein HYQ46_004220 [Verticillium longisporum]
MLHSLLHLLHFCDVVAGEAKAAVQKVACDASAETRPQTADTLSDLRTNASQALWSYVAKDAFFGVWEHLWFQT